MNITAADLRGKLYIYNIFTDFKFFDLSQNTGEYMSIVKGFIEIESRDEEVKIMFSWKAIGGTKTFEDAFVFNIDIYDPKNSIEIEGVTLVDSDGRTLNKTQTTDALVSFLTNRHEWKSKIKVTLPVAATTKLGE